MSNLVRMSCFAGGLETKLNPGNVEVQPYAPPGTNAYTADANGTLLAAALFASLLTVSGQTAGRTLTTDTAASMDAYFQSVAANAQNNAFTGAQFDLGVGESVELTISNQAAQVITLAAGVGVTITSTKTTVAASSTGRVVFTRTGLGTVASPSAYNMYIL